MKLNCKLKALMEQKEISQMALAQETGLAPSTVGKLARNQVTRFDENTVKTLCQYFDLGSINELIEIEWEPSDRKTATRSHKNKND